MLRSFKRRVINKFDELKSSGGDAVSVSNSDCSGNNCPAPSGGLWYYWGGQYRRVPHDYRFPNKMTLKTARLRYFLLDRVNNICPMRYFSGIDRQNVKTGRRNISAYKVLMQYIISEAKKKKIYTDKLTED